MNSILSLISEMTPIHVTETGEKVVYGRELHKGLEINQDYESWIEEMIEYGLKENRDYFEVFIKDEENLREKGRSVKNHILTLRGAKHILYVQDNDLGYKVRDILINGAESQANQEKNSKEFFRDLVDNHLDELLKGVLKLQNEIEEAKKLQTKEKGE